MIQIHRLICNLFQVNLYILSDESGECVIIDPGCHSDQEKNSLSGFIRDHGLKPVAILNTHSHIDHILGNQFAADEYGLKPRLHEAGLPFLDRLPETAASFGMEVTDPPVYGEFINEGDVIHFGNSSLKVLYTPGHADGSVCFLNEAQRFIITGDVLFNQSIGRTDLPTGDFDILQKSILEKLYTLPDDYTVYPGHGPETTIGFEKINNPFISG